MDFLNEFSKRFSSVARSVSEKSKESAEVTRLNAELRAATEALEGLYARYGKVCYAIQTGNGDAKAAEALAVRIRAGILQVDELTAQRDAAREFKRCLSCGAIHPKEAKFCATCGKRLPDEPPKPEPVAEGEYCPSCGALRESGEQRCPVCGAYFIEGEPEERPVPAPIIDAPDVEEPDDAIE
ncbi:MAG: zinc ribbon domain-containing protein [Clostridia bacterium]|nr:zinc ribbon domain-containing protein [Clostridia bacterium]